MNKVKSKELITKAEGGEYIIPLMIGDLFVSIHLYDGDCLGFFLSKNDVRVNVFEIIFQEILTSYPKDLIEKAEVKLIGILPSVVIAEGFFKLNNIQSIKKIEKDHSAEVMFFPILNKVRVSKDSFVSVTSIVSSKKFKILIVDDSKTIRNILLKIFSSDPQLEVCAMAERPSEVESLIKKFKPDVITLDIHMPEMDGISLLKMIGPKYNIPTIMISSISIAEGPLVLEAL